MLQRYLNLIAIKSHSQTSFLKLVLKSLVISGSVSISIKFATLIQIKNSILYVDCYSCQFCFVFVDVSLFRAFASHLLHEESVSMLINCQLGRGLFICSCLYLSLILRSFFLKRKHCLNCIKPGEALLILT